MAAFVFGLLFLAVGGVIFYKDHRLTRNGQQADAEVVDLDRKRGAGDEGPVYYPVVRFRDGGGAEVVARTKAGGNRPSAWPGQWVRVRYEITNPQNVVIDTVMGRGLVLGGIAVLVGLGVLVYGISQMAR